MLYAKDFRSKASSALSGRWRVAVGTGFVAIGLGAATTALNGDGGTGDSVINLINNVMEYIQYPDENLLILLGLVVSLVSGISGILGMVRFFIGGAITIGYARFNLNLVDGEQPQFSDVFSQFDRWGQAFLLQLLRSIFTSLWTLLFIIPGLVATYSYSMAPYILYENPDMSGLDAITRSKHLMEGNKWRLFCLDFSFIGWGILCIFTLGIGVLWLAPYREAAYAAFYRDITQGIYSKTAMDNIQDAHRNDDYLNEYNGW